MVKIPPPTNRTGVNHKTTTFKEEKQVKWFST